MDHKDARLKMQIAVSAVVGLVALGIIIFGGEEASSIKWAFGMVGLIVGYWLK